MLHQGALHTDRHLKEMFSIFAANSVSLSAGFHLPGLVEAGGYTVGGVLRMSLETVTTRSMFDGSVADDEGRSQAAGFGGKKSRRERRRLDQQVGVNVDEQVSRMFSGELYTTVVVRLVNDFLHQKLIIHC